MLQICLPIIIILLVISLIVILYMDHIIFGINGVEKYANINNFDDFNNDHKYLFLSTQYPFNNTQIGTTRNMSYDLRGDVPIPYTDVGPWLNSPHVPIYNKPLYLVS